MNIYQSNSDDTRRMGNPHGIIVVLRSFAYSKLPSVEARDLSLETPEVPEIDPVQQERAHLNDVVHTMDSMLDEFYSHLRYATNEKDDADEAQTAEEVAQAVVESVRQEEFQLLTAARREPYFGRLDFQEHGHSDVLPLYIGKRGVENRANGEILVVDWRAPVASLFYSFSGQEIAQYESPSGPVEGQVYLKRNISIRNGKLDRVVDSFVLGEDNLNVADSFLLYRLGENKDNRLRDIVSTIQAEQDRIIRADRGLALIIQGVAGSGKTTVALHRLAYLLYQYSDKIRAERMVIFAPNAMFVDYISEVLPELGVGGIIQTTFFSWALQLLNHAVRLRPSDQRVARWFAVDVLARDEADFELMKFKGSQTFLNRIDQKLEQLERSFFPHGDFEAWPGKVLSESMIYEWFANDYVHYPLAQRRERVLKRVKRWYEIECKNIGDANRRSAQKKLADSKFRAYKKGWTEVTFLSFYRQLTAELPQKSVSRLSAQPSNHPVFSGAKRHESLSRQGRPEVDVEDLAPLLYIYGKLHGIDSNLRFDHVVIDEAQDFSSLELYVLQSYCPSGSFTILGDLSQSIHTYRGISEWDAFTSLFDEDKRAYFQLDVSYRSTTEIIEFANSVIGHFRQFTLAKPVFRSGEPVVVKRILRSERLSGVVDEIRSLQDRVSTIAVVCRSERDCLPFYLAVTEAGIASQLISGTDQHYRGGVSVLPVYLTKGLEFDAVILVDVDSVNYDLSAQSAKLLYVGCTRALHQLVVHYTEQCSPLLETHCTTIDP